MFWSCKASRLTVWRQATLLPPSSLRWLGAPTSSAVKLPWLTSTCTAQGCNPTSMYRWIALNLSLLSVCEQTAIPEVGSYRISYLLLSFVPGRQTVYRDNINSYYPWSATGWSKCRTTKGKYVTSTQWSFIGDEFGSLRDSVCWLADLLAGGFLTAHLGGSRSPKCLAPTKLKQYIFLLFVSAPLVIFPLSKF